MLATVVCGFVREEDRQTVCVRAQMDFSNTNWHPIAAVSPDKAEVVECTLNDGNAF